MLIILR